MQRKFGAIDAGRRSRPSWRCFAAAMARHRRTIGSTGMAIEPLKGLLLFGWETLAYLLFGMAALKNGFLRGGWSDSPAIGGWR